MDVSDRARSGFAESSSILQGHQNDCFRKISVRKSKHGLEFSIGLGRLKISRCPFHSCAIFEACLIINFLRFSERYIISDSKM